MTTILVVEDDYNLSHNIVDVLENSGYDVELAANGFDGLNIALQILPDLILCDVMMPQMDGYELLEQLNKNPKTSNIPFIFLTAKVESKDLRKGMILGADDYLFKPFKIDDLLNAIETRIKKRHFYKNELESLKYNITNKVPENLRDKLFNILGFSHIIEEEFNSLSNQEITELNNYIISAGKSLHKGIEKLIVYSNLLSNKQPKVETENNLEISEEYFTNIIFDTPFILSRTKDIKLNFSPAKLKINKCYFDILFNELIENAILTSPADSEIKIEGVIKDNSYSIELLNYIKDNPSFYFDNMNKNNELGMPIVLEILSNSKGKIEIKKTTDNRNSILLSLPIYKG